MKLYTHVCKLSNVKRFASLKLDCEYSGADHSFRVAILAMLIADEYNVNTDEKLNVEEILRKSLIHDIEESITGDIPTPVKEFEGMRPLLRQVSEKIMKEQIIDESLKNKDLYLNLWKNDKDGKTGEVVAIADKLEALMAASYEVRRGNREMYKPFSNIITWFKSDEGQKLLTKFAVAKELYNSALTETPLPDSLKIE